MQRELFFDILRFSLGITDRVETSLGDSDWSELLTVAEQQSLIGVLFSGIERMPKEQRPQDRQLLMTWFAASEMIRQANKEVSQHAVELVRKLSADGFDCCVLKGQGNALLYPDPAVRTPGDIDLWVTRKGKTAVREVIDYVRRESAEAGMAVYHHIDYGTFMGTEVEVHYRPSFMHAPWHNRRLQRFFSEQIPVQFAHFRPMADGTVAVPTVAFNRIYLLLHIGLHLIQSGIGLRQLVDYYYVLRQDMTDAERTETRQTLKHCGLTAIAGAVMYVMQQLFWLDEQHLLVPPDERRGRFLLNEMMEGGNFGQYDARVSAFARQTALGHNLERLRHDCRTLRYFPSESLWEPVFRLWHFGWRLFYR